MDFRFDPADEAFRRDVRAWLEQNSPASVGGTDDDAAFDRRRNWQRRMYEAGYVGLTWPVEFGGRGGTQIQNAILQEELVRAGAPGPVNALGIGLCGPAILHHGSEAQKRRYLAPMLRAEEIWCQGYSEPGAGSDLAGLATRAELRGDRWVVNGQKIWTSMAHRADWCFALVRTDPDAKKHEGIGFLLIEMRTPGIEVRPIVQITGVSEFNEVFFTDVEVPAENVIGAQGGGWRIANTVLGYERGANTLSQYATYRRELERMRERCRERGDAVLRDRVARIAIDVEVLRLNSLRQLTALAQGRAPGAEASIQKLHWSELDQRFWRLSTDLEGARGQLWGGPSTFAEVNSLRFTIARGTSEIQRNIISERVLGLPRR